MPRAVAQPIREALWRAYQQGQPTQALAERFTLPLRTVQHLLQQARANGGPTAPAYAPNAQGPPAGQALRLRARALRQEHPDWGCELIRLVLAEQHPLAPLPCSRTLRRWLRQAGQDKAPPGRRRSAYRRACGLHQTWQ